MKYRPEIDGLRAVAVISVMFYHLGLSLFSGGYVGVDVFFVISGYLITYILITEIKSGDFRFLTFYDKRIRRLFPALLVMVLSSFIAAYFLFMPDEFAEFAQSAVASSIYLSNIFFWLKSDYFSGPSELKPLLHTWSLAIEEQFYFVFPILLVGILKYAKSCLVWLLSFLSIISFFSGIMILSSTPSASFFLSPFRFWELLSGCILAIAHCDGRLQGRVYGKYFTYAGICLILIPVFIFYKGTPFPGYAALLPVLGTLLVLANLNQYTFIHRVLSFRALVFVGKISYSLYLWHWPIIVFYGYWLISPFTWFDKVAMLFLTFVLSVLSFHFVETKFRKQSHRSSFNKSIAATILLSGFIISLGVYVSMQSGIPERFSTITTNNGQYSKPDVKNECFLTTSETFEFWKQEACLIGASEEPVINVLWGDSHANHLLTGLMKYESSLSKNMLVFANAGCPPVISGSINKRPNCLSNNLAFFEIIKNQRVDNVFLAASWFYALDESGFNLSQLSKTLEELEKLDVSVYIINQLPIYSINSPEYLLTRLAARGALDADYELPPAQGMNVVRAINETFGKGGRVINLHEAFCESMSRCSIYKNGNLMVSDRAHLSPYGSKVAIEYMIPLL